jgi:hypothetical protein
MFQLHNLLGFLFAAIAAYFVWTGPIATPPGTRVPESVRANPASYRPVYVPTIRGSGGGSGGWSGGK